MAAAVIGSAAAYWIIRRLNQAEADQIEKLSHQNYTRGSAEAKAAEVAAKQASEKAKSDAKTADPTDW